MAEIPKPVTEEESTQADSQQLTSENELKLGIELFNFFRETGANIFVFDAEEPRENQTG